MTGKIFKNAFLLGAAVLIICAALFFGLQYSQTVEETYDALRGEAAYAATGLAVGGRQYLESLDNINRITWIDADGSVLYDNRLPEPGGNQGSCPEVAEAIAEGSGRDVRGSETDGESTMYYAFLCEDGTVLRLSRPLGAVQYALMAVSPVLWVFLLVLIISGVVAFRVASEITRPINALNLDDPEPVYPELEPLVRRINEQRDTIIRDAAAREELRKEFTANVSHELKTPLTSITGFAELMRDGLVPPERIPEFAGDIYRESRRMTALVEDVLRLGKLDEERGFPDRERISLGEIAMQAAASLRPEADKRGIAISVTGDAETEGVRQIVEEMVYNLIDNAVKYNRDGGSVAVRVGYSEGRPGFAVADTGIGIPEADRERVFERFYRVDKSHSRKIGGTGLGLSIVKHGAKLHEADVKLTSEEGNGTTVEVRFPAQ